MAAPQGPPGNQPQGQPAEVDPISKFKMLIPRLKESLAGLMKVGAQVFHMNAQVDSCTKPNDTSMPRFDRSLEDFYAICDQIELNLRMAVECAGQFADSQKHTPMPVQGTVPKAPPATEGQPPAAPEQQPYTQYLTTVKAQMACAKEVHDALLDCARKVGERGAVQVAPPLQAQAPPMQQAA